MRALLMRRIHPSVSATAARISLCFLLTSSAYLAWTYHCMDLFPSRAAEAVTLIAGYLFQAMGIGLHMILLRRRKERAGENRLLPLYSRAVTALHLVFLFPAVLGGAVPAVLFFGAMLNLCCGWIAGEYLFALTDHVRAEDRAVAVSCGYSIAILGSWLLSLIGRQTGSPVSVLIITCVLLTAALLLLIRSEHAGIADAEETDGERIGSGYIRRIPPGTDLRQYLVTAGCLVLLFSLVNNIGFGFPSADLQNGIHLEFTRLFYAAGLLAAGLLNDRSRRSGALCAVIALVVPFVMLSLQGESVYPGIFWALNYFTFGFYTTYRLILFSDIAGETGLLFLSGCGLMIGRIGDAVGESLNLLLAEHTSVLVVLAAVLYAASMLLFFHSRQDLQAQDSRSDDSEPDRFDRFSGRHDLSAREREVLRLLLEEKSNTEIAETLCVTESTVKYHIHNLLRKTGCSNRVTLLSAYVEDTHT